MINKAKDVNRAVEEVNTIPMLGFMSDIVEVVLALPDPIKISVIYKTTFFFFQFLKFFSKCSLSISKDFNIFSGSWFSQFDILDF